MWLNSGFALQSLLFLTASVWREAKLSCYERVHCPQTLISLLSSELTNEYTTQSEFHKCPKAQSSHTALSSSSSLKNLASKRQTLSALLLTPYLKADVLLSLAWLLLTLYWL